MCHRGKNFSLSLEGLPTMTEKHVIQQQNVPSLPWERDFLNVVCGSYMRQNFRLEGRSIAIVGVARQFILM